jgi:hypothetical protein
MKNDSAMLCFMVKIRSGIAKRHMTSLISVGSLGKQVNEVDSGSDMTVYCQDDAK